LTKTLSKDQIKPEKKNYFPEIFDEEESLDLENFDLSMEDPRSRRYRRSIAEESKLEIGSRMSSLKESSIPPKKSSSGVSSKNKREFTQTMSIKSSYSSRKSRAGISFECCEYFLNV